MQKELIHCSRKKSGDEPKDIVFLTPPYWDFYSPFSAVPHLVANIKKEGFRVGQYDIGIHYIHHLLEIKWKEAADYCLSNDFYETQIKGYINNTYHSYEEYKNDMWFLKNDDYFDVALVKSKYFKLNAVQRRVLDAFYLGVYLSDVVDIDFDNCNDLAKQVNEWDSRKLIKTLCGEELKGIFENVPNVVGISITSTCQFIPGCFLAKLLKTCRPDTKIVLGGSCVSIFAKSSYSCKTDLNQYFDYIIEGEGETALVCLMKHLRGMCRLEDIPNLLFISSDGEVHRSKLLVENVNELPAPDYDGLNLSLYLAPKVILPYQTSRGCHYGRCAFCGHDENYRHHYRSKQMNIVVEDLIWMSKRYDSHCIQFVDEAIRPDCFKTMVDEMDNYDDFKQIKWFYYSRVSHQYDKALVQKAHKNGCRMVMFGVESFNQRLLNFIKKGINAETSKYCLELFHQCGIKTYIWLMSNLPSETLKEARDDLEEVKKMKAYIDAFVVGPFHLWRSTDMYENQENYNIISIDPKDPRRFQSYKDGVVINKEAMLGFIEKEYSRYQQIYCATANRYTFFFEA